MASKIKKKLRRGYNKFFHRAPPGSSPGTILPPIDPNPTQILLCGYGEQNAETVSLDQVKGLRTELAPDQVNWISVIGLQNMQLIQDLCQEFDIHRLTVEDIMNQYQRPKVEYFDDYIYISLQIPKIDGDNEIVSILMGETYVISLQDSLVDHLESIRNRIQKKIGQIRMKDRSYLTYAIVDAVIDLYFPLSEAYAQRIEGAEANILSGGRAVALLEIFDMRTRVNFTHRILWSHNQLISQLIHDPETPFGEEAFVYLRDCFDHTLQILDFLETLKESAKTLIDLQLSLQGHRSNEIMKVLTIITSIFIPMTFISGIYGMNFNTESRYNMPELNWLYGYPMALGLMLVAGGSMLFYFYRQNWFASQALATQRAKLDERNGPGISPAFVHSNIQEIHAEKLSSRDL